MSTKYFDINSETPTLLEQFSNFIIAIVKIDVIEGDINDLFSPIKVSTTLPSGEGFQYYIHASNFYSNRGPGKGTDLEMKVEIHYCNYTSVIISQMSAKRLVFRLYYLTVNVDPLNIIVNKDLDGYTFTLSSLSKELILSRFKDARPIRNISVGYDVKESFEMIYGKIEKYILPTLTDLTKEQLDQLGEIFFRDASTNKIIKKS